MIISKSHDLLLILNFLFKDSSCRLGLFLSEICRFIAASLFAMLSEITEQKLTYGKTRIFI